MTIAYNSAYFQTGTLNFTSPNKPLLCILMPNAFNVGHDNGVIHHRACGNGHFACVKCYIFVHFSSTPSSILNLTIARKPMKHRLQQYIVCMEILPTFHT